MSKVLIVGAKGMLGWDVTNRMRSHQTNGPGSLGSLKVRAIDIGELDITDADAVQSFVKREEPDLIINCAAYTDVDGCESHRELAFAVNASGPGHLAQAANAVGAHLLHISTDFVFDGNRRQPYVETDAPNPLSVYGKSKLEGERQVADTAGDYLIVRTAWLYGEHGNNFVQQMLKLAHERAELRVVDDQWGSAIWKLLEVGATGLFHAAGGGACSRYEFAREIVKQAGLETRISAARSAEFPRPARRPAWSVLDHGKLRAVTGYQLPHWRDSLAAHLQAHLSKAGSK